MNATEPSTPLRRAIQRAEASEEVKARPSHAWFFKYPCAVALMLCTAGTVIAAGESCDARHQFAFLDGVKSCLTDTPFAEEDIVGWNSNVRQLSPRGGLYSIAASPHNGQCPQVVAMTFVRPGAPGTYGGDTNAPVRSETARKDCQRKLDSLKAAGAACDCTVAVVNGQSPLTQAQFDTLFPHGH